MIDYSAGATPANELPTPPENIYTNGYVEVPLDGLRRLYEAAQIGLALAFGNPVPEDLSINYPFDWMDDNLLELLK